jgi:hypothetical protein
MGVYQQQHPARVRKHSVVDLLTAVHATRAAVTAQGRGAAVTAALFGPQLCFPNALPFGRPVFDLSACVACFCFVLVVF